MARNTTITDEQILDAARAVFVEEGFRPQTLKIARLAGVSEGTIFKRFETKERLFLEALRIPHPPPWYVLLDELAGVGDVRENLITIGADMLTFFQQTLPSMMAATGAKMPPGPSDGGPDLAAKDLTKICGYLEKEQALGRIRATDTTTMGTVIFGCFANPFLRTSLLRDAHTPDEIRQCSAKLIDILWDGMKPESE